MQNLFRIFKRKEHNSKLEIEKIARAICRTPFSDDIRRNLELKNRRRMRCLLANCLVVASMFTLSSAAAELADIERVTPEIEALSKQVFASIPECVDAYVDAHHGNHKSVRTLACSSPITECAGGEPDLTALARVPNLTSLDLSGRCIKNVVPLTSLTKLKYLELAGNAIEAIRPLGKLKKLVYLGIADNPVLATWFFNNREPFSELSNLEELVLDGTSIDNILPLSNAKKLRTLSLRRMPYLASLRPLAALPKLRVLHVDDNMISDLRPLADLTRLQEFTADRTLVSSVEPLRALVGRKQLHKVSLRGTCVAICDVLNGADHDCSDPLPESQCFVPEIEFSPLPENFAVPLPLVERFAPTDLPIWSSDDLARGYEAARSSPDINWTDARSNCDGRAYATAALFASNGYPAFARVMSLGNLRMLSNNDPLGFYMFDWHVAITVRAQDGNGSGFFVIDPTLDDTKPMRLADWFARQVNSAGSPLDFSCEPYWNLNPGLCAGSLWVDTKGYFLVDPIDQLRGVVCRDSKCGL